MATLPESPLEVILRESSSKTPKPTLVSRKRIPPQPDLVFNEADVKSSSLNVLGLTIDSGLTWKEHIYGIAAVTSQKLGFLFGVWSYFSCEQSLALYESLVRPYMK